MAYSRKWRPSATQRREFAKNMQDADYAAAYHQRKEQRAEKRRESSQFDYEKAGGYYVASKAQHDFAVFDRTGVVTPEQQDACNQVVYSFSCNEKINHDLIHIVNELIRAKNNI